MPYIESQKNSGMPVKIYYEEYGKGKPVLLIHGWPVSHEMWEYQLDELPAYDLRCIAYDRRGFGKSDRPYNGYDYMTMAEDLKSLLDELDLQDVTLVGFSMGGGEVVRYCSKYNCERISKVILVSSIAPYLMKADSNPEGVDKEMFDTMEAQLRNDRPAFLNEFGKQFFGVGMLSRPVSNDILDWMKMLALNSSPKAVIDCLHSFSSTDFRSEMKSITVPTLVIHGDSDKTVPINVSGKQAAAMIPKAIFKIYEGSPHGLFITSKQELTADIASFAKKGIVADYDQQQIEEIAIN
ncbi:MAG TPA: alpha/beta hydrolase [Puia sp.]|jgi:pimeloyl-ACP methyl ester carboxylesterase|nr:alpha/beta hydrolase [Puia sp.]